MIAQTAPSVSYGGEDKEIIWMEEVGKTNFQADLGAKEIPLLVHGA